MSRTELNGLGSIAAADAWFEIAAFVPPPISIASAPEEQGPWSRRAGHPLADWKFEIANDDTRLDRKSVVSGKRVSVRVDLGGRRIIKKKKTNSKHNYYSHKQSKTQ